MQNNGYYAIQGQRCQYHFEAIADYWSNFRHCIFEPPPPPLGFEATYTVNLRLIEKLLADFLFILIELFSLGIIGEVLQTNNDWKLAFLRGLVSFGHIFM